MSDTYMIYEYNYAGYYTGNSQTLLITQGYPAGWWAEGPLPDPIPSGQYARFNGQSWFLTDQPCPPEPAPPEPASEPVSEPPVVI